jgi:hypothetical protein
MSGEELVFIGPGSEWFWIALQFVALAITFYAIYRQLRIQQRQTGENTKVLRTQAHYNALLLAQRPFEMLVENESLAKIVNIGYATPDALSGDEWVRCGYYFFMQFNAWEYFYYQDRDSSIPTELWVGADAYFKSLVATKRGLTRFWDEFQTSFDEPFHSYVTQEFAKKPSGEDASA